MTADPNPLLDWLRASGAPLHPAVAEDDMEVRQSSWKKPTARQVARSSNATVTGTFAKRDFSVVEIESKMEFDYAEILDADPRVRDFITQAPPLDFDHDGRRRQTFFDFDAELVDDSHLLSAVKPKRRQGSSGIHRIVEEIRKRHSSPDRRFVVIDEDHLADHTVRNARLVNRALREDEVSAAEADEMVLDYIRWCTSPPQVVDVQIALDLHGRTLTSVARLARRGLVRVLDGGEWTIASVVVATSLAMDDGAASDRSAPSAPGSVR